MFVSHFLQSFPRTIFEKNKLYVDDEELLNIPTHNVPVSKFGHSYILNFTVCGEFELDIFYCHGDGSDFMKIFRQNFCCK